MIIAGRTGAVVATAALLLLGGTVAQADFVELCPVPAAIADRDARVGERDRLELDRNRLQGEIDAFNRDCGRVARGSAKARECQSRFDQLRTRQGTHNGEVTRFCARLRRQAEVPPPPLVDKKLASLLAGESYKGGDRLRALADRWPVIDKARGYLAALLAEVGRYADAGSHTEQLKQKQPSDRGLRTQDTEISELIRLSADPSWMNSPARDIIEQLNIRHLTPRAQTAVVVGLEAMRNADYDTALRYFREAQQENPNDRGLRDVIFLAGQTRLAAEQPRDGPPPADKVARRAQREGATAALNLAFLLMETGKPVQAAAALHVYRERHARLVEAGLSGSGMVDQNSVRQLISTLQAEPERMTGRAPPVPGTFRSSNKANLMLDALAYGKGNWPASLNYLDIARRADPGNLTVLEAYNELADIAATAR